MTGQEKISSLIPGTKESSVLFPFSSEGDME